MAEVIEAKLREAAATACEVTAGEVCSDRAMARVAIRRTLETCGYLTCPTSGKSCRFWR